MNVKRTLTLTSCIQGNLKKSLLLKNKINLNIFSKIFFSCIKACSKDWSDF